MNTDFNQTELSQYARHFTLPEIGAEGQLRLKNARVLVVGAGGLGSSCLLYLAAAGVGTIGIVDHDQIELSNLQRQILYSHTDVGIKKALAAKQRLATLNPSIQINVHDHALTHENALQLIQHYDVVVDGSDNFATRYIVNDACFHLQKPNVHASVLRFEGQCTVFTAGEEIACYRCLFDEPPAPHLIPSCREAGVLGVLPGILGTIQATEVMKLIIGIGSLLTNRVLMLNALDMRFREMAIQKNPDCRLCQHQQPYATLPHHHSVVCEPVVDQMTVQELKKNWSNYFLLDVREPFEYQICHLGGQLIPLQTLSSRLSELDKNQHIVVHCRSGMRSQQAVELLRQHGFPRVSNLAGGILAWINEIDSTMVRY